MELISNAEELRHLFKTLMERHRKYFWISPFAKSTFPFIFDLADHESKIMKISIGLNGLDTSPTFINEFFDCKTVRYFNQNSIFNPVKIFLFYSSDSNWDLLSGTVALNKISFEGLPQLTYHLSHSDDADGSKLENTFKAIDFTWEKTFEISEEEYEEYWESWSKELTSSD